MNSTMLTNKILFLDEHAAGHPDMTINEMRRDVAGEIAYQFARVGIASSRFRPIQPIEIRAILVSHGASPFTIKRHVAGIVEILNHDPEVWNQ